MSKWKATYSVSRLEFSKGNKLCRWGDFVRCYVVVWTQHFIEKPYSQWYSHNKLNLYFICKFILHLNSTNVDFNGTGPMSVDDPVDS